MELSQASEIAALLATADRVAVQEVDFTKLKQKLSVADVVFAWPVGVR